MRQHFQIRRLLLLCLGLTQMALSLHVTAGHGESLTGEQKKAHYAQGEQQISIHQATVRGLPPGQKTTAAFLNLTNNGEKTLNLKMIKTEVAEKVEVHETIETGGQMQMRKIEQLSIDAGQTIEFKPSGKHLMLMGLTRPLKDGEVIEMKMCFGEVCRLFEAKVVSVLNEGKAVDHSHHH